MEGKANIGIGQVNNKAKQKVTLSYFISPIDSVKEAQVIKYAFDQVAEKFGASIVHDAIIIGVTDDAQALAEAAKIEA